MKEWTLFMYRYRRTSYLVLKQLINTTYYVFISNLNWNNVNLH